MPAPAPESPPAAAFTGGPAATRDLAACRERLAGGSRSFHLASLLLPRSLRDEAAALYAFCRVADDAIDEGRDQAAALQALHRRLADVYRGRPADDPVDRALSQVVRARDIPRSLLLALLEGFAWDAGGRRYGDLAELTAYAVRVAGTVGVMMALLMGRRDSASLARAADLGIAMQFTNIARDVGEDAAAGRVYLPGDWLREAGIDAGDLLATPRHSPALGSVVQRLLAEADRLYRRADSGIARLPARCRPAIYAARQLYAGIGDALARQHYDAVSTRAVLSAPGKLRRLSALLLPVSGAAAQWQAPPLAEAQILLQAATDCSPAECSPTERGPAECSPTERGPAECSPTERGPTERGPTLSWVLELFAELERRERRHRDAPAALPQR